MNSKSKFTAEDVYNKLIDDNIFDEQGKITFSFAGINVDIDTNDIVGNIMQSWLKAWFLNNNILFAEPDDTQKFPDFYLDPDDIETNLLEVKAFNFDSSPAFDIANFESYCESVVHRPYRFHAKYLIFGYRMIGCTVTIEGLWLKNIWEITSYMQKFPLTVQNKRGIIYNIRPTKWYSLNLKTRKPFNTLEEFIIACYKSLYQYNKTRINADDWIRNVIYNYNNYYIEPLNIVLKNTKR